MSPLELIDAALELLLSGGNVAPATFPPHPAPDEPQSPPPGYRKARRCGFGWTHENDLPVPVLEDLLPPDMRQKFLDLWLATGTNVLFSEAQHLLGVLEDGGPDAAKLITDSLEVDIWDRLAALNEKWEGGNSK